MFIGGVMTSGLMTYWFVWIEFATSNQSSTLEILGKDLVAKFTISIALPGNVLLIDNQILLVAAEAVCVIEQTPGYKTTWNNWSSSSSCIFRITCGRCILIFRVL